MVLWNEMIPEMGFLRNTVHQGLFLLIKSSAKVHIIWWTMACTNM